MTVTADCDLVRMERFWAETLAAVRPTWLPEIDQVIEQAEARRSRAQYDTGTISRAACLYVRALSVRVRPRIAVEIGTFIGSSTFSMQAGHLYTCDKSNDCVPSSRTVTCYPFHSSTKMLRALANRGVLVDFFFIDGRLREGDEDLLWRLSTRRTVYAFDDYEGHEKGVINVDRVHPSVPTHHLIPPPPTVLDLTGQTTIAVLWPEART